MEILMSQAYGFKKMLKLVEEGLEKIPEHRTGKNKQYELKDAGLSALSVFYMQSPSFLSWQRDMEKKKGKNNARSLFGIGRIPSDEQIKNLLDPVQEKDVSEPFWAIYHGLEEGGVLAKYKHVAGTYPVSLDGTQHHSSTKVHCEQCRVTIRGEKATYAHQVLLAMLGAPGQEQVIALEPEFITPQDGHEKQDCEQAAIKRWVKKHAKQFAPWSVTVLTDDLHCHQPTCQLLTDHEMYFILTCKEESHSALYEELALLARVEGAIGSKSVRRWNGRYHECWRYRWAESLPLRRGEDALLVNWCELTILNDATGELLYRNAWATNHRVNAENIEEVAAGGRSRWKVENEGINVLKNQGYHFEHNFGHGKAHLSNVLLCFLLLAFLIHSVLHLTCKRYRAIRQALGARRTFFESLRSLTRFLYFDSWLQLLTFMYQGLDLESG
jgi:hypothetical protein